MEAMMRYNEILTRNKVDAIWVSSRENKKYLTGFMGSDCEVVLSQDKILFITDGRYKTAVKTGLKDGVTVEIIESNGGYKQAVYNALEGFNNIGIEGTHLSIARFNDLKNNFSKANIVVLEDEFEALRLVKNDYEIQKTKEAIAITDKVFDYVVQNIKPGMTEVEVKLMIENQHILNGAQSQSFDPIVASGTNSAKPHAHPTDKVIENGDIVTLDFGCFKDGYCSDMTRTFFVGEGANEELKKIHQVVLDTMNLQIKHVKNGVSCKEIDRIGREYLNQAGYEEYFIHGTGHGIGLEIHEGPYLNKVSESILQTGMLITIEPGIYIEGLGGVRIEQDVLVLENGYEILNNSNTSCDVYNNK
jgi:Xaa-Pro aminopeptidase